MVAHRVPECLYQFLHVWVARNNINIPPSQAIDKGVFSFFNNGLMTVYLYQFFG